MAMIDHSHKESSNRVRAKFNCEVKTETRSGFEITLSPVYSSDANSENARFFKETPGGTIKMSTINPNAAEQFVVGKAYFVDFTLCDDKDAN